MEKDEEALTSASLEIRISNKLREKVPTEASHVLCVCVCVGGLAWDFSFFLPLSLVRHHPAVQAYKYTHTLEIT